MSTNREKQRKSSLASGLIRLVQISVVSLIVTVLGLSVTTSMTALIFAGPLTPLLPRALGLAIFGAALTTLVISSMTSIPGIKSSSQDVFSALLAVMVGGLLARLAPDLPQADRFLTVLFAVALVTLLAGVVFFVFGLLRLTRLVRFLPYPVVGGFVAGTGWLLFAGAVRFMIGGDVNVDDLLAEPLRWLPGILFALLLLLLNRRVRHPAVFPIVLFGSMGIFFLVALPAGHSVSALQANGWLLGPFPERGLLQLPVPAELGRVDWRAILREAPAIASTIGLSMVALLLNVAGIELAHGREVDLEREMRIAGLGNIVAGLFGGMGGYHSLSQSVLTLRMGADSRWVGIVSALLFLLVALAGGSLLALFPRVILGGLIGYLGLSFLYEWIIEAPARLPGIDYAIVLGILVVIANFGFMAGIVVGLLATIALFVINYSWIDVVRRTLDGRMARSRVTRAPAESARLADMAQRLLVMELHGFLFFGTAFNLQQRLQAWLAGGSATESRYIVIDMANVSGLDTTATMSFVRMRDAAVAANAVLILSGADSRIRDLFARVGLGPEAGLRYERDRDLALELCEEALLDPATLPAAYPLLQVLAEQTDSEELAADILTYWERVSLEQGDIFIRQGSGADDLFWVESGRVTAQLAVGEDVIRLETMTGGRVVGELGFFLDQERTADVVADEPTVVYRLTRDAMGSLAAQNPPGAMALQRMLIGLLSERLTHLIRVVGALR